MLTEIVHWGQNEEPFKKYKILFHSLWRILRFYRTNWFYVLFKSIERKVWRYEHIHSYMICLIDISVLTSHTDLWLFLRIWFVLLTSTCWHRIQTSDYSFVYDLSYWHQSVDIVYKPLTIPSYMICLIDINVLTSLTNLCSCNSVNSKF